MDEDVEIPKENIDRKAKEAIDTELENFLKPKSEQKPTISTGTVAQNNPVNVLENTPLTKPAQAPVVQTNIKKPIIRTYKSDMDETIQSGHMSSISIAISENNKLFRQTKTETEEVKKLKVNKNILIISAVLLVGGTLAFAVPYLLVKKSSTTTVQSNVDTLSAHALITADIVEKINISTLNLSRVATTLRERVQQSSTALGQVKNIILSQGIDASEQSITSSEFIKLLKAHIPVNLERTLKNEYMFGMHNFNGNQEFLILKIGEYDTAFSAMLSWENDLWQDFKELFFLKDPDVVAPADSSLFTSTGTPQVADINVINPFLIEIKKFQDATFNNKDARIVKSTSGKILFLYSIIDDNTIVITTSTDTLREIISRLNQAKVSTQQ